MFKHYLKVCSKMVSTHILSEFFMIFACPIIFAFMLNSKAGWYFMDIAMTIAYTVMIYSAAYKIADKDIKAYSEHKPYIAKGLVIALPIIMITFILTLLYDYTFYHQFADYDIEMRMRFIIHNIFRGWNFTFEAFRVGANGEISVFYWILSYMLAPLASFCGYLAGMNRYELGYNIMSRLVYKRKDK